MAKYQMTLFFRQYERGWSENFYVDSSLSLGLGIATAGVTVVPAALQCRDNSTVLQAIRLRSTENLRQAQTVKLNLVKSPTSTNPGQPDVVEVAARVRINSVRGVSRSIWIRGLDDDLTRRDGARQGITVQGSLATKINQYLTAVQQFGGAVRYQLPADGLGDTRLQWHNILGFGRYTPNPLWTSVKVSGDTAMPAVGDRVYFKALETPRFLYLRGGLHVMAVTGPDTDGNKAFVVDSQFREQDAFVAAQNTQWRWQLYDFSAISNWGAFELGRHDTGRPTTSARGRRSPVTRRRLSRAG
jgi:hypothetical protein